MDRVDKSILPKHIQDLWKYGHTKPIPSVWDFGFVTEDVFGITKQKPYFEFLETDGKTREVYFKTPEYDIYLVSSISGFELYFLYDSENKDSVVIAASLLKKYKIKFEE